MPANQPSLFTFEAGSEGEKFEQSNYLHIKAALWQWYRIRNEFLRSGVPLTQSANAVGLWGERVTHELLWRVAEAGGYIEYQKEIKDARADFFITGLARYPRGIVIETKVLTGTGSHSNKIINSMLVWRSYELPAIVLGIGNVISTQTRALIRDLQSADIGVYTADSFIDWIVLVEKAQQKATEERSQ